MLMVEVIGECVTVRDSVSEGVIFDWLCVLGLECLCVRENVVVICSLAYVFQCD